MQVIRITEFQNLFINHPKIVWFSSESTKVIVLQHIVNPGIYFHIYQ
jgi:hypothetical protein